MSVLVMCNPDAPKLYMGSRLIHVESHVNNLAVVAVHLVKTLLVVQYACPQLRARSMLVHVTDLHDAVFRARMGSFGIFFHRDDAILLFLSDALLISSFEIVFKVLFVEINLDIPKRFHGTVISPENIVLYAVRVDMFGF